MTLTLAAIIVAALGPLGAYIAASRRLSGKIATSEASSLWAESASIREDYRSRIADSEKRQAALEARVAKLEAANNALRTENLELRRDAIEKDATITRLAGRAETLETENQSLRATLRRVGGL